MATPRWRSKTPLIQRLLESPGSFEFVQAIRLIEMAGIARSSSEEHCQGAGLGHDEPLAREFVRFRVMPTFSFPGAPIRRLTRHQHVDGIEPIEAHVACFGLIGPSGVLPQFYTELVQKRQHLKDETLRNFLDAFHHRAVSFFWRASFKYRFHLDYERELRRKGGEDAFTRCVWSLAGVGTRTVRGCTALDDSIFAYYAGLLANRSRTSSGLAGLLGDFLGLPVTIDQFVGRWLEMDPGEQSRLPGPGCPMGRNNQLGGGMVLGGRVWDVQSMIRIRAGPMDSESFEALVPGSPGRERLRALVLMYVGIGIDCEFEAILKPGAAPMLRLGAPNKVPKAGGAAARLGFNTFLQSEVRDRGALGARFSLVSSTQQRAS